MVRWSWTKSKHLLKQYCDILKILPDLSNRIVRVNQETKNGIVATFSDNTSTLAISKTIEEPTWKLQQVTRSSTSFQAS